MKKPNPILISTLLVLSFALAASTTTSGASLPPAQRLPRSAPEAQGISSAALLDFITAADTEIDTFNSFMLVRHGHVIAEGWWTPYGPEIPHVLFSLSKSFTSTAVGLAINEGKLSLDDRVMSFFPDDVPGNPAPNLPEMRLRDLLIMSSGQDADVIRNFPFISPEDPVKAFLRLPVDHKPGSIFVYNTPGTFIQSAIVQKVVGEPVVDYLGPRLFEPLGMGHPVWDASKQGVSFGGFGLNLRTEDIACFGQLFLQKGQWQGKQLIPAAWVETATSKQTSNGSNPNSDWDQGYGYQFWRCRPGFYRGDGAFGQYCIVMPQYDAVVAITSGVRNMQAVMNLVWEKILPAFKDAPLPADAAGDQRLKEKLAGLTIHLPAGSATSPQAASVSGKTYIFPANDRKIESLSLTFAGDNATLVAHDANGDQRIAVTHGSWQTGSSRFVAGLERGTINPVEQKIAAAGAWTSNDTYTIKLCCYETPFYATMQFQFAGDRLIFDTEYNAAFGPTTQPQLVGHAQ